MRNLLLATLICCSLPAFAANTCTFSPQGISSGHSVSCALPALDPGQCVEYRFHWSESGSVSPMSVNVKLNTSTVYPSVSFSDQGNYELSGRFCIDAGQLSEYTFNSPSFEWDTYYGPFSFIAGPSWGTAAEDVSIASTLTFNVVGGRGWSAYLNGGAVEIK
jgi:hypothetical protein